MLPVKADSLEERPLGGMETALIRLSDELQKLGHQVIIISPQDNPPLSHPLYLPIRAVQHLGPIDVLITIREWRPAFASINTKKIFFWTGDSYNLPQSEGIGDRRIIEKLNAVLCVSSWHADTLCAESGFPREKAYVLRNGIHADYFKHSIPRKRKRLIYSSTPFRGLKLLPAIFSKLKQKHSDLELHVFSDYAVYTESKDSKYYQPAVTELAEIKSQFSSIEGCFMHGNVKQDQLAKEMLKSSILAYPNTFEETSCITALEAQAAGCAIISSYLGALPETVGDAGILIKETPGSAAYIAEFTNQLDRLLSDDALLLKLSKAGLERAKNYSWEKIAKDFADYLSAN